MGTEKLEEKKQGKEASAVSLRMDCSPLDVSSPHLQALCVEQEDGAEEARALSRLISA